GQYLDSLHYLSPPDRTLPVLAAALRDVRLVFQVYLVPLSHSGYLLMASSSALALAGMCVWARLRAWPLAAQTSFALGAATCWMTVLGPATESCTYILIAPTLASCLWIAWHESRPAWARGLVSMSFGLLVASQMANWFPNGTLWTAWGQQPIAGLMLLAGLASCLPRKGSAETNDSWEAFAGHLATLGTETGHCPRPR